MFAGRERDESGLVYMRARYYDPTVGRFISPDPLRIEQQVPDGGNRYCYVGNSPAVFRDPTGVLVPGQKKMSSREGR